MPGIMAKAPPNYNKTLSRIFFFALIFIFSAAGHTPFYSIFAREGLFVSLFATDSPQAARNGILAMNSHRAKSGSAS